MLETGKIPIALEFREGTEYIYVNPTNTDIYEGLYHFQERVLNNLENLKDVVLNYSGTPEAKDENTMKIYEKSKKIIYDEFNKIFGYNVTDVCFKYCNALALVNGKLFIVNLIEYLMPKLMAARVEVVENEFSNLAKEITERYDEAER